MAAHLQALRTGVKILVCGTCLDYYKLKDNLKIGEISNMYDITEKMFAAQKSLHCNYERTRLLFADLANTHAAMMAEGILAAFEITIIPTLREISAGCGISIAIKALDIENVLKQLKTAKFDEALMDTYAVHHRDGKSVQNQCSK